MKVLLLNQTFYPDVMATGQYLTEVALRLVERGHQVTVVTGRRAYDHPKTQFSAHETWRGIRIFRIPSTGFGKATRWRRAADFASFVVASVFQLAFLPRHDTVVALTTPPLISFIGAWQARLWRTKFVYWVMDFNPDEAIAAGWLRPSSPVARMLDSMSRFSLRQAASIIALDGFMRDRIVAKGLPPAKVAVIPPWVHDSEVRFDPIGRERFRRTHGLDGKFVIMYSGNHSPVHPLDTLLAAAERLRDDPGIAFCFVGGGSEWRKIAEAQKAESRKQKEGLSALDSQPSSNHPQAPSDFSFQLSAFSFCNKTCLPYQPLDQLSASLSSADLHVVVMGESMVGLVHPCKIYNILTVGAPVLYIGPKTSHVTQILEQVIDQQLWGAAAHGDVDAVVGHIQRIRQAERPRTGDEFNTVAADFSKDKWLPQLVQMIEEVRQEDVNQ